MKKYLNLTIEEIHQALVAGETTAAALVEEAIAALSSDPYNVLEADNFEGARAKAAAIAAVEPDQLFKGIPFLAKDNLSTAGIETTASSNILNGYRPIFDAEVIRRLDQAGAILLGKTTLDELAMGGTGTTGHRGVTLNPYDPERIIGGSSCGSAAATAAGYAPLALGSDTGDSVRKPAAYGGLVGFKPTWGRISRYGLFPFAASLDTVGFFTRSVRDSALTLELLAGVDPKDMSSSDRPVEDYAAVGSGEKKIFGYFPQLVGDIKDANIITAYQNLLAKLKAAGHQVREYVFPAALLNAIYPTYMIISCSEATSNNANLDGIRFGLYGGEAKDYGEYIAKVRTAGFSDLIKRRFIIGSFSLLADNRAELFTRAQKARRVIVDELKRFFAESDILLLPAAPTAAARIADVTTSWSKHPDYLENHLGLANLAGLPSITLPLGFSNGLPIAVNLTGRAFEEKGLFAAAQAVEDLTGLKGLVKGEAER